MKPYQMSEAQVCQVYRTDISKGLTHNVIADRKKYYGANTLPQKGPDSWVSIFVRQFRSPLIYILLAAALIIFFVGEDHFDAFIITGILLFNALIGTIQEGRTSRILASLKTFMTSDCVVIRDGTALVLAAESLVPGDLVILQEGQRVPADIRLVTANNMHVDEAILTGESSEVFKNADPLSQEDLSLMDQRNMIFKGTYILSGSGKGIVVAIGLNTEIGRIQVSAQEIQTDMPLKRELNRLSGWILLFVLSVCFVLFLAGLISGKPVKELLTVLTALFICVVPEGLPVVLTLVLVSGVYRMAQKRVLIKKLAAVETLGRTDVIVIDKTGTLTRNEMMVSDVYASGIHWRVAGQGYHEQGHLYKNGTKVDDFHDYPDLIRLGIASSVLSNAQVSPVNGSDRFVVKGDPTEAAMAILGNKLGFSKKRIEKEWIKKEEIPFDSRFKIHAIAGQYKQEAVIFVAGAPETIFNWSVDVPEQFRFQLTHFLQRGLRVVAVAAAPFDQDVFDGLKALSHGEQLHIKGLQLLGLCGIQDAIRSDIADSIELARNAGLAVIMATGDHQQTALYVANTVGIYRDGDTALDGSSLEAMNKHELRTILPSITVYSRVTPINKLDIINLWHQKGHVVAMTGDGVNDVPSLVAADIGIAMGDIGTEIAKEAADIILLDDSFNNIVAAIEQGRHIFYTLRRVVLYFFATNMGEVLIILFAMLYLFIDSAFPLPLTAAQILWLNLITDGFLDMALSMEPQEKGLIEKQMITKHKHIFDTSSITKTFYMALPMALGSLLIFMHYYRIDLVYARTMTLMTMAMFQWFNAWNCRSEKQSLFSLGLFSNTWLIAGTVFVLALQLMIVYVPWMNHVFKTVPLFFSDWITVCLISSSVLMLEEGRKWISKLIVFRKQRA